MDKRKKTWLEIVKGLNAVLMAIPFAVAWYACYRDQAASLFYIKGNTLVVVIYLLLYVMFGRVYDAFSVSRNRISEMVYSQGLAVLVADFFMYLILVLLIKRLANPLPLLAALAAQVLLATLWSCVAQKRYFALFSAQRTAIVYDTRTDLQEQIQESWMSKKFDIQLNVDIDTCLENLDILADMETVFMSGIHSHDRNIILKYCVGHDITTYVIPRIGDVLMSGAERINLLHLPMLRIDGYKPTTLYLFIKRVFDILVSSVALVLLSPLFLITAIAVKAYDGGPVFYHQKRLTKGGKVFDLIKFRSMRVDAESDGVARLSTGSADERITPVGRVIRQVRLDELPQLLCILKGDMTICGPRPERPEIAARYEETLPEFRLRLQAKAGLTGYAQVFGKYNTTPYDKLQLDLMYLANPSILEDLRIIFATIKILFMEDSTEGVKQEVTESAK